MTRSFFYFLLFLALAGKVAGPTPEPNGVSLQTVTIVQPFQNAIKTQGWKIFQNLMVGHYDAAGVVRYALDLVLAALYPGMIPPFRELTWFLIPNSDVPATLTITNLLNGETKITTNLEPLVGELNQLGADVLRRHIVGTVVSQVTGIWSYASAASVPGYVKIALQSYMVQRSRYFLVGWPKEAPDGWPKNGPGNDWKESYVDGAYFFKFLQILGSKHKINFISLFNYRLRFGYDEEYFVQLIGFHVNDLWNLYVRTMRALRNL